MHGTAFRMTAIYQVGASYSTAFVATRYPATGNGTTSHTCGWQRTGDGPWTLTSACS